MSGNLRINGIGFGGRKGVWKALAVVLALCLLLSLGQGEVMAKDMGKRPVIVLNSIVDGTWADSNGDGNGDWYSDGATSVVVGFNTFTSGDIRGVYQFDIRSLRNVPNSVKVIFQIRLLGHQVTEPDPNLTLYWCPGIGSPSDTDYTCDRFVTGFSAYTTIDENYDIFVDVTGAVRQAVRERVDYLVLTIRPNPINSNDRTAWLFNSTELSQMYGYPLPSLTIQPKK